MPQQKFAMEKERISKVNLNFLLFVSLLLGSVKKANFVYL